MRIVSLTKDIKHLSEEINWLRYLQNAIPWDYIIWKTTHFNQDVFVANASILTGKCVIFIITFIRLYEVISISVHSFIKKREEFSYLILFLHFIHDCIKCTPRFCNQDNEFYVYGIIEIEWKIFWFIMIKDNVCWWLLFAFYCVHIVETFPLTIWLWSDLWVCEKNCEVLLKFKSLI